MYRDYHKKSSWFTHATESEYDVTEVSQYNEYYSDGGELKHPEEVREYVYKPEALTK